MNRQDSVIAVVGDTHGHLQLAFCVLARWQETLGAQFEAVFLCGDVGTFTDDSQLDSTTRRHGRSNPCELEFLTQWSCRPQAPWLSRIFARIDDGGLGLTCPVIMVHGNHEGFTHLERLTLSSNCDRAAAVDGLPGVDTNSHIRLLPSGRRVQLPSGLIVGGIGGIEEGQRAAKYHRMAYIDPDAVLSLTERPIDLLITHQGPSGTQGQRGSETLQVLLENTSARVWCHGHSVVNPESSHAGTNNQCLVVPLGDIAFAGNDPELDEVGQDGWCLLLAGQQDVRIRQETPPFLRDFRRKKWLSLPDGRLVCPPLVKST